MTSYTRDPDGKLISQRTPTGRHYYLFDALGSVVGLTNASGEVVARYRYDPYASSSATSPWSTTRGASQEATSTNRPASTSSAPATTTPACCGGHRRIRSRASCPAQCVESVLVRCLRPVNHLDRSGRSHCAAGSTIGGFWGVATRALMGLGGATFGITTSFGAGFAIAGAAISYGCEEEE